MKAYLCEFVILADAGIYVRGNMGVTRITLHINTPIYRGAKDNPSKNNETVLTV